MTSDLRYTLRSLLRARWFTVAAVFTFALGIGVNVAVFSAVDRILLRSLPYRAVDELVTICTHGPSGECSGGFPSVVAFEGRTRLTTIDDIAVAAMPVTASFTRNPSDEPPLRLSGVSANLLRVLRVQPVLGRDFTDEDERLKRRVALLSYESWVRRVGQASDVITRSIGAGAIPTEIVGVLPAGFVPPTSSAPDPAWDGLILDSAGWAAIGPT